MTGSAAKVANLVSAGRELDMDPVDCDPTTETDYGHDL